MENKVTQHNFWFLFFNTQVGKGKWMYSIKCKKIYRATYLPPNRLFPPTAQVFRDKPFALPFYKNSAEYALVEEKLHKKMFHNFLNGSQMWVNTIGLYPAENRYQKKIYPASSLNNALDLFKAHSKNFSKFLKFNSEMTHDQ